MYYTLISFMPHLLVILEPRHKILVCHNYNIEFMVTILLSPLWKCHCQLSSFIDTNLLPILKESGWSPYFLLCLLQYHWLTATLKAQGVKKGTLQMLWAFSWERRPCEWGGGADRVKRRACFHLLCSALGLAEGALKKERVEFTWACDFIWA